MTKEEDLKKELERITKEYHDKEKEIYKSQEWLSLEKEQNTLYKKRVKNYEEQGKLKQEIKEKYLENDGQPIYKERSWESRNIKQETINGIKRGLGISNLSHLKTKDIEEIVNKIIRKDMEESQELKQLEKEYGNIQKRLDEISKRQTELSHPIYDLRNQKWEIERDLKKYEQERRVKEIKKDPKQNKKILEEARREEAQSKINKLNIDDIRTQVGKELIISQLSEENE